MLRLATRRAGDSLRDTHPMLCRSLATHVPQTTLVTPASTPPNRYPVRGGQNLTSRFRRLEKSLRGRDAYEQEIEELYSDKRENEGAPRVRPARSDVKRFMGFTIPKKPQEPGPGGECLIFSSCLFASHVTL